MAKKGWGNQAPPYLTIFELERLIQAAPKEHQLLLRLLCYTGARVSEILALAPKDIDFTKGELRLPALKSKQEKFKFIIVHDPLTLAMLKSYAQGKRGKLFNLTRQRVWQIVHEAGQRIGITGLHPHVLRDSFAYNWVKSGGDLTKLQRQLGHASYATTADRYLKYQTIDIAEEGKKLAKAITEAQRQIRI